MGHHVVVIIDIVLVEVMVALILLGWLATERIEAARHVRVLWRGLRDLRLVRQRYTLVVAVTIKILVPDDDALDEEAKRNQHDQDGNHDHYGGAALAGFARARISECVVGIGDSVGVAWIARS